MNIVDEHQYDEYKRRFFSKHNNDFQCETEGSSAEYYHKTYVFADGATRYEVMQKKTVVAQAHYLNVEFPAEVEVMETEFWSSDDSESKYWYQAWDVMLGTH